MEEDTDFPMITSPFLHRHDGKDNGHRQYANRERRWSRSWSGWQRRISSGRSFGFVRLFPCPSTARIGVFLGLLMLLLIFAFWTTKSPELPPVAYPPVTDPPVTGPPVTDPPVMDPLVTDPPVTDPPVADPPVADDSIFKVSFPQFQAKNGTNPFSVGGVRI